MGRTCLQILGAGCKRCEALARNAETAAVELGLDYSLEKIGDITRILEFDLLQTPGLVIDGRLCSSGSLPSVETIKIMLLDSQASEERP